MTHHPSIRHRGQRGFTLVEAILVMVITGILAGMVSLFIRMPVKNYIDSAARAELTDIADTALRRMTRDIRLALPNSFRANGGSTTDFEFILTKSGGSYLSVDDNAASGIPVLDFTNANNRSFHITSAMPAGPGVINQNDQVVVYNLGPGYAPADAYSGGNIATVTAVDSANRNLTLAANPFASALPMPSPMQHFQVVATPVTYICDTAAGTLTRYANYAISANKVDPTANPQLLADHVTACNFNFTNLPNTRLGLFSLSLTLTGSNGDAVTLFQQVHVDATP